MSLLWHIGFTLVKAENGLSTSHTFIIEKIHIYHCAETWWLGLIFEVVCFFPTKTESLYCFRWIPRGCHKRWFGKSMLPLLRHLASAQITVQSMQKRLYLPGRQKVSLFTQPGACFWQRVKTLETKRNLWVYWRKNMQVCKYMVMKQPSRCSILLGFMFLLTLLILQIKKTKQKSRNKDGAALSSRLVVQVWAWTNFIQAMHFRNLKIYVFAVLCWCNPVF